MLDDILSLNPWIEVFFKYIYWKSSRLRAFLQHRLKKSRKATEVSSIVGRENFESLKRILQTFSIKTDDILIIHSSFTDLQLDSVQPEDVINFLIENIVPNGTLVVPAMPIMKNLDGKVIEYPGIPEEVAVFDIKKSPPWTGVIPRKLLKYPGAIRFWNPINNIVAYGREAAAMMSMDLFKTGSDEVYPSGIGSPWDYMRIHDAKIVSLGTDLTHSLTMIHCAEDVMGESWPIQNWYRKREFLICREGESTRVSLNERDPKWAINFAERTLNKDLIKGEILKSKRFNNSKVEFLSSAALYEFLSQKNKKGYPYFTFWKKR